MAALKKYRTHAQFGGQTEIVEIEYDFAKDGGSVGALDVITFTEACVLISAGIKVDTTFDSASDTATLAFGVSGGTTDLIVDATGGAQANLTAGSMIVGRASSQGYKMAAATKLIMTIGTEAFTAGKCRFVMEVLKF